MAEITKNNKKIGSAFNVATAEFIRDHKSLGQAVDDDITTELVTEFELDTDGIEALLTKIQDAGISIIDKNGEPSVMALESSKVEVKKLKKKLKRS